MKPILFSFTTFLLFLSTVQVYGQDHNLDSLKAELTHVENDTTRLVLLGMIANRFRELTPDSALAYGDKMLKLSTEMKLELEESFALAEIGYALINMANYPRSLQVLLNAEAILEDSDIEKNVLPDRYPAIDEHSPRHLSPKSQRLSSLGRVYQDLGILYFNVGDQEKALSYWRKAVVVSEEAQNIKLMSITYSTLGRSYLSVGKKDSAVYCLQKAFDYANQSGYSRYKGSILLNLGHVHTALGDLTLAKQFYQQARQASIQFEYYRGIVASCLYLAELSKKTEDYDSTLYYINSGLPVANYLKNPDLLLRCYQALADYYTIKNNNDSTVKYLSRIIEINNSQFNAKRIQEFQNIDFNKKQQQLEFEAQEAEYQAKLRTYFMLAGILVIACITLFMWRNSMQRKKSNDLLSEQKENLEATLADLKRTQNQLIQSEKMASLGELTAGIAHEIQNPLNFVNNFSEVSNELIKEIQDIRAKTQDKGPETQDSTNEEDGLLKDIASNLEKIIHHGKRADGIVKGMLQHSRGSSGRKEPTDINELCDEYVRLAYHGLRAKDKSFNAKFETDFDPSLKKINVMQQDIGRVILNLITNAFYAVSEKSKGAPDGYQPEIKVSTASNNGGIQISIWDNGKGITEASKEKIFQPFFTTKPTGQGTGLGLSLSYDIIKAHGGLITVNSKENEGSTFIVELPSS